MALAVLVVYDHPEPTTWADGASVAPLLTFSPAGNVLIGIADREKKLTSATLELIVALDDVLPPIEAQSHASTVRIERLPHRLMVTRVSRSVDPHFRPRLNRRAPAQV